MPFHGVLLSTRDIENSDLQPQNFTKQKKAGETFREVKPDRFLLFELFSALFYMLKFW
jgi:hypothetical protein